MDSLSAIFPEIKSSDDLKKYYFFYCYNINKI